MPLQNKLITGVAVTALLEYLYLAISYTINKARRNGTILM